MTDTTNRIAAIRKQRNMSQQQLADKMGAHWVTLSRIERGKMQLTVDWLRRIATALDVDPRELLEVGRTARTIELDGAVVNGSIIVGLDEDQERYEPVKTDDVDHFVSQWFKIEGDELAPFLRDGDLLKATYFDPEEHPLLLGRLAAIRLDDERILLAVATKHWGKNRFDVRTANGFEHKKVVVDQLGPITEHIIHRITKTKI